MNSADTYANSCCVCGLVGAGAAHERIHLHAQYVTLARRVTLLEAQFNASRQSRLQRLLNTVLRRRLL